MNITKKYLDNLKNEKFKLVLERNELKFENLKLKDELYNKEKEIESLKNYRENDSNEIKRFSELRSRIESQMKDSERILDYIKYSNTPGHINNIKSNILDVHTNLLITLGSITKNLSSSNETDIVKFHTKKWELTNKK